MNAAQLRQELADMEQALIAESQRYNDLWLQFDNLRVTSNQLCCEMAVMCEAQLAGDHELVMRKVAQFTNGYVKNCKPAGGRVH